MKAYIPTCDKYIKLTEACIHSCKKFFDKNLDITILGYDKPQFKLDPNVKFISLGKDTGPENWSNDLIPFFNSIDDDFFYYFNDDSFILNEINQNILIL